MASFAVQKDFRSMRSHLFLILIFMLMKSCSESSFLCLWVQAMNSFLYQIQVSGLALSFCAKWEMGNKFHSCNYTVGPWLFVKDAVFSSIYIVGFLDKNRDCRSIYMWVLISIPLINKFVFMPVQSNFNAIG